MLKFEGDYSKYNGNYLLSYKRVFYATQDDGFKATCNVGFVPISSIEPLGVYDTSSAKKSLAVSFSSTKMSSARTKNTSTKRGN